MYFNKHLTYNSITIIQIRGMLFVMKKNWKYFNGNTWREDQCRNIYFILFIIFFISHMTVWAEMPVLKVGIFLDCHQITLKGDKGLYVYEKSSHKELFFHKQNQTLKIKANSAGIEMNDQIYHSIEVIKLVPGEKGFIQVEDRKYRGEIEIVMNQQSFNVINIIEIEEYLYGVLKKEISPEWPDEVLKAQAIASRTFALSNMNKYIDQGYNICATTNSQAYGGVNHEDPATNKAVNDTKGIVITYQGEPINAVYHSDSGGYTENSEDVWGSILPYLRSVPSDYEEMVSPPNHQWDCTFTGEEILAKLKQHGIQLNSIDNIVVNGVTESGRVQVIDIFDFNQEKVSLKTNDFRLFIGPTLIRSPLFTVTKTGGERKIRIPAEDKNTNLSETVEQTEKQSIDDILKEERDFSISELIELLNRPRGENKPEKMNVPEPEMTQNIVFVEMQFTFNGKGNGHGVGLSQWGAYGMSTQGFSYEEILKYYYQGVELIKLY